MNAHTDHADGLSRAEQHSGFPVLRSGHVPYVRPSPTSSLQSYYTPPYAWPSNTSSLQSFHTALAVSPFSISSTSSASTWASNRSFPYSVNSTNSYKSRKNVLYPRRAHPLPVAKSSEHPVPPDALIWQVRFLCTTLLPHTETRLVPAGKVLLQALGLSGDFSQSVPVRTNEETRCCSELFIALTHEVLLKDAISTRELEGPCKLLHATFKDILFKSGAFSSPTASKSNESGHKASSAGALAPEQFSSVLRALRTLLDAFEGAMNAIKPGAAKDGALQDHYRMALLELSVSTGLTMDQYRKKLDQSLAQTQAQSNSFLGQPEWLVPPSRGVIQMTLPYKGTPKAVSTIEEGSEADGDASSASGHTRSHSSQSHSTRSHSDSGKSSLSRRIMRRLLPSSVDRKKV